MANRPRKTQARSFSTTPLTDFQITALLEKLDMLSSSEVVRYAVSQLHKREFPDYIYNRTAVDVEKRQKIAVRRDMSVLDDLGFAEEYIGKGLSVSVDGNDYYLIHNFGNFLRPVPLSEIRQVYDNDPGLINFHKNKSATVSVEESLTPYMLQYMQKNFKLDLSHLVVDKTKQSDNTAEETEEEIANQ